MEERDEVKGSVYINCNTSCAEYEKERLLWAWGIWDNFLEVSSLVQHLEIRAKWMREKMWVFQAGKQCEHSHTNCSPILKETSWCEDLDVQIETEKWFYFFPRISLLN